MRFIAQLILSIILLYAVLVTVGSQFSGADPGPCASCDVPTVAQQ